MNKLPRRRFLHMAAVVAALSAISRVARAQTYPARPVRWIVGFRAGSAPDLTARLMGQWLSERLGQQFVIENRSGAVSNLAVEAVVRAPADGYTLLFITAANAANATLYENLPFNLARDIAPVAGIMRVPGVMVVNPSVPARTLPEFIAYAKANPGKINMASDGSGSAGHLFGELFKMMAGVDMLHVPYRGNIKIDLIAGEVQVAFSPPASVLDDIKAGKLRALAVTTTTRQVALPDVPTVAEFVPGYEATVWQGVGAPRSTPVEIINRLNKEINAGLADPRLKGQLADLGGTVLPGSPADFGKLVADEIEKWGKVIRSAHIKPD